MFRCSNAEFYILVKLSMFYGHLNVYSEAQEIELGKRQINLR
jgi:hypothetical protein